MDFHITTKEYSGPMDLLLQLIEESKINIYNIDISTVTRDFVDAMERIYVPPGQVADFLIFASTLLLIKSNSLIPNINLEEDPTKEDLISRLLEYKAIKEISEVLRKYELAGSRFFSKLPEEFQPKESLDDLEFDIEVLQRAYLELSRKKTIEIEINDISPLITNSEVYSISEYLKSTFNKIKKFQGINFNALIEKDFSREEKIIVFISILELLKQKKIFLNENYNFYLDEEVANE